MITFEKKKNRKNIFYFILFLIFILSIINSIYQYSSFDKTLKNQNFDERHQLINGDIKDFWSEGHSISEDIKNGKNYFETGGEYRRPYLPSRLFALYSLISSEKLIDQNHKVLEGGKKILFLFVQSIFFYFLLFFLYKRIINFFPILTSQIIVLFLAIEPTIFMYHSSFWSESIFLSFLLILILMILKNEINNLNLFFIGFMLGILYLQRSVAIFYILPILLYFLFKDKRKFFKIFSFISIGYLVIHLFVGYHNFIRLGTFYSISTQAKDGIYIYLAPLVLSKNQKITQNEALNYLNEKKLKWVVEEKINLDLEIDRLKYYDFQRKEALKLLLENPLNSLNVILSKTKHFFVIDPVTHVYHFHRWDYKNGNYYKSYLHEKWKIPRVLYSVFIYLICFIGLLILLKKRESRYFLFYLILSILYFSAVQSWYGGTRYFAPILIYLSFFFGHGTVFLIEKIKTVFKIQ